MKQGLIPLLKNITTIIFLLVQGEKESCDHLLVISLQQVAEVGSSSAESWFLFEVDDKFSIKVVQLSVSQN